MTESCHCGAPDCIPAGDPRYDGFRITELWMVVQIDPNDDQEGLMYTAEDGPLIATDERRLSFLQRIVDISNAVPSRTPLKIKHFKMVTDG